ncbi:hypothetical protein K1T71_002411 [Dendrolimus kikuchii]|uniref:Uncharacterized protein n=1 Tax=Dendrolimus kikuchii TaxID=765133 RepID=A0ACC1DD70_9NEOP|nr:hypothetical protein K1T71_002411 [Dendrolimus kikuchii]
MYKLKGCIAWWWQQIIQPVTALATYARLYTLIRNKENPVKMFAKLIVVVAFVVYANGYSIGAPESACIDMIPRHPVSAKDPPAPYTITTSTDVVKAGTPMKVTISGKTPSDTIKGILLQAREVSDNVNILGKFIVPADHPMAQTMNCGQPDNAVTHKKHEPELDQRTITFTWMAPSDFTGAIKFRATIAYDGAVFWVGEESPVVKVIN